MIERPYYDEEVHASDDTTCPGLVDYVAELNEYVDMLEQELKRMCSETRHYAQRELYELQVLKARKVSDDYE